MAIFKSYETGNNAIELNIHFCSSGSGLGRLATLLITCHIKTVCGLDNEYINNNIMKQILLSEALMLKIDLLLSLGYGYIPPLVHKLVDSFCTESKCDS